MSPSNLQIVERSVRAAIAGDFQRVTADLDTQVELDQPRPSGVYHGRSGVAEAMQRWSEMWVDRRVEAEEFIDAGSQVVVITHEYAKSERTGMALERRVADVWTLRGGKVVTIESYPDRAQALVAVGLADDGADDGPHAAASNAAPNSNTT
jgi:ketosteroid isomerase-like protein